MEVENDHDEGSDRQIKDKGTRKDIDEKKNIGGKRTMARKEDKRAKNRGEDDPVETS